MKKSSIFAIILIIAIIVGLIYINGLENKKESGIIKIGQISALTGVGSDIGQEERNGALLAVEYINKNGGVNGKKIEMISEDVSIDKLKNTSSAIQKLVNIDKVSAIIGPQWDEASTIAVTMSKDLQIPIVSPNSSPQVEQKVNSKYFFSTFYSDEVGIKTIARFAKEKGYKRIAIVEPVNFGFWKYTSDLFKKYAKENGIEIVSEEYGNDFANTDYKTLIAKAKMSNPDAVFGSYAELECLFLKQAKDQGLNVPLLSTESAGTPKAMSSCSTILENSLFYSTPVQAGKYMEFEKTYTERFGSKPLSPSAVTSYDAVLIIAEAMREGGETQNANEIVKQLEKMKFSKGSSLPEIIFDDLGFVITKDDAFTVNGVKAGEFVEVR